MGEARSRPTGNATHGFGAGIEVEHRAIALGRGVELPDLPDAEAMAERLPHVGPKAIADAKPYRMGPIRRIFRRLKKVAAEFSDIDEHRAPAALHVRPELAGREALADHTGASDHERQTRRHDAAVGVVHRQAIVDAVVGSGARYPGKRVHGELHTVVIEIGGFRQPGRAGGIDQDAAVLDREGGPLGRRQHFIGEGLDQRVEALPHVRRRGIWSLDRAIDENVDRPLQETKGRLELRQETGIHDDQAGFYGLERMGQGGARQIGIDERRRCTGFGDPHPDRQVLGAVEHHERHDVAATEPLPQGPARITIGTPVPSPVGHGLMLGLDGDPIAVARR